MRKESVGADQRSLSYFFVNYDQLIMNAVRRANF